MGEYTFRVFRKFLATTLILSLLWPDMARCMRDENDLPKTITLSNFLEESRILQEEQNSSSPVNMKKEEDDFSRFLSPLAQKYLKGIFKITAQDLVYSDEELFIIEDHSSKETAPLLNIKEDSDQKIINKPNIEHAIKAWDKLVNVEGTWRNHFTWANLESLPYKFLFTLFTNEHAVNEKKLKKCCPSLWLYGRAIPLENKNAMTRNVAFRTLGSTLAETALEIISTTLIATLGYQFYEVIHSRTIAASWSSIADFFSNANSVSLLGIINNLHKYPGLFSIIAIPIGLGLVKSVLKAFEISSRSNESAQKAITRLKKRFDNRSDNCGQVFTFNALSVLPVFSSFLDFHPIKRDISRLEHLLLWNAKLSSKERKEAFEVLLKFAQNRKGLDQMAAIEALAHLAHGWNIRNLELVPSKIKELLKIKIEAFLKLNDLYKKLPCYSLNKFRTGTLLWEIGQSPFWGVAIRQWAIKAIKSFLYGLTLYALIDVLHKYATCSKKYLENFSWLGGLTPYANDYSKECFDAQIKVFNLLPEQPASTLVGNLTKYHFSEPYDLDLSNKWIINSNSSVIAEIVEEFKQVKIPLSSLNISGNVITTSSNLERIVSALPSEIKNIDMTRSLSIENSSVSLLGLGRLTGLQSLNLSDNSLDSFSNRFNTSVAIGQVLQDLPSLQELRLRELDMNLTQIATSLKPSLRLLDLSRSDLSRDPKSQIALGKALAQNLTLHQLYLRAAGIGGDCLSNMELAKGLAVQYQLSVLDLNHNLLGFENKTISTSTLLSSLPFSLTNLDISFNFIGRSDTSEITSLAQAIQQMKDLRSFKARWGGTFNYPGFLKALQGKKNLTVLNLSHNYLNATAEVKDLLQTISNLEILDLSENELTNGSLLAASLSTFRNITELYLGGNNFTTEDRLTIWKATSSLPKLTNFPFYLDEDLNFTTAYLNSLPSTTTTLNLSGLIPNNSTAFQTIMPQVVNLFPNLKELDLSKNQIVSEYQARNYTIQTEGIKALISYLPQLKNLQSLKISEDLSYKLYSDANPYFQNLSYTIGQLQNLRSLDLSYTSFFYADSLGKGLEKSSSLISVDLDGCCGIGEGGAPIIQGLQAHPNLTSLNLLALNIGVTKYGHSDPNSTLILANALKSWPYLQHLNLAYNGIGIEDFNSSAYFLEKLSDLAITINKQGKVLEVNLLEGIYNTTWTQGASVLQILEGHKIQDACARQLCSGGLLPNITFSKKETPKFQEKQRVKSTKKVHAQEQGVEPIMSSDFHLTSFQEPTTSRASTLVPFYQPVINSLKPWFSMEAWGRFFDKALDSMASNIQDYSQRVVENTPSYFSGMLDKNKQPYEDQNKQFYNYPTPHFCTLDQDQLPHIQLTNYTQVSHNSPLLQLSYPSMLTSSSQPLMLSN